MPEYTWICDGCTYHLTKSMSITKYNPKEKVYCPNCGIETRRKIENEVFKKSLNNFYICSLSSKSIIYKGLYLAEAISDFYLDLKDKRFIS